MIEHKDQSAHDLKLNVIQGGLDLTQFRTLVSGEHLYPHVYLKAYIIGASHVIAFKLKGFLLCEVFACIDVATVSRAAFYGPLRDVSGSLELNFPGNIIYIFKSRLVALDQGKVELSSLETLAEKSEVGLVFQFPSRGNSDPPPKTIVVAKRIKRGVLVKTAHSYPNENNLVFTQTIIKEVKACTDGDC